MADVPPPPRPALTTRASLPPLESSIETVNGGVTAPDSTVSSGGQHVMFTDVPNEPTAGNATDGSLFKPADGANPKLAFIELVDFDPEDLLARILRLDSSAKLFADLTEKYNLVLPHMVSPNSQGPVGCLFHQIDDVPALVEMLAMRAGGAAVERFCLDRGIVYIQDDVDILMFLLIHSFSPIAFALELQEAFSKMAARGRSSVGSITAVKAKLFGDIALKLTSGIPLGPDYAQDRIDVLGPHGANPTVTAILHNNVTFVSQPAIQAFVDDVWGTSEATADGIWGMITDPRRNILTSLQVRWLLFVSSHIVLCALNWVYTNHVTSTSFNKSSTSVEEVCLFVWVCGKALGELYEWAMHTVEVIELNPSHNDSFKSMLVAIGHGARRHLVLDPWNSLDLITSTGFCVVFVLRLVGDLDTMLLVLVTLLVPTFVRMLHVFELHGVLGPMVRSIINMLVDIITFLLMFSIIIVAFTAAFTLLFADNTHPDPNVYQDEWDSALTMFRAALGDFDFTQHEYGPDATDFQRTKERFGTVLLILYLTISHITLLNVLIAVLSATYEFFQANSRDQFLFGRARSIMTSVSSVSENVLPAPLNLIQSTVWLLTRPFKLCVSRRRLKRFNMVVSNAVLIAVVWPLALLVGIVLGSFRLAVWLVTGLLELIMWPAVKAAYEAPKDIEALQREEAEERASDSDDSDGSNNVRRFRSKKVSASALAAFATSKRQVQPTGLAGAGTPLMDGDDESRASVSRLSRRQRKRQAEKARAKKHERRRKNAAVKAQASEPRLDASSHPPPVPPSDRRVSARSGGAGSTGGGRYSPQVDTGAGSGVDAPGAEVAASGGTPRPDMRAFFTSVLATMKQGMNPGRVRDLICELAEEDHDRLSPGTRVYILQDDKPSLDRVTAWLRKEGQTEEFTQSQSDLMRRASSLPDDTAKALESAAATAAATATAGATAGGEAKSGPEEAPRDADFAKHKVSQSVMDATPIIKTLGGAFGITTSTTVLVRPGTAAEFVRPGKAGGFARAEAGGRVFRFAMPDRTLSNVSEVAATGDSVDITESMDRLTNLYRHKLPAVDVDDLLKMKTSWWHSVIKDTLHVVEELRLGAIRGRNEEEELADAAKRWLESL